MSSGRTEVTAIAEDGGCRAQRLTRARRARDDDDALDAELSAGAGDAERPQGCSSSRSAVSLGPQHGMMAGGPLGNIKTRRYL